MPATPAYWLLKTEPTDYSFDQLEKAKRATWDGVANPTALKHLREARPGDLAVIYHTGKERRAIGLAEVVGAATGTPATIDLRPRGRLKAPVDLEALKAHPAFAESPLVKIGRLSVVPLSAAQWKALLALAKTKI